MKLSEGLEAAKQNIVNGWIQGDFERDGGVCALGAIHRALAAGTTLYVKASQALEAKVREILPDIQLVIPNGSGFIWHSSVVSAFNDMPERTKDDVLALFEKTIAGAQERGE